MSKKRSLDEVATSNEKDEDVWVIRISTKYGQEYWYNETTGKSVWQDPTVATTTQTNCQTLEQNGNTQKGTENMTSPSSSSTNNHNNSNSNTEEEEAITSVSAREKQVQYDIDFRRKRLLALSNPTVRMRSIVDKCHGEKKYIVFDDAQCIGGTKQRLLSRLLSTLPGEEFIYAGPDSGLAQVALAYSAYIWGKKATIFLNTARSTGENDPPPLVKLALMLGAKMRFSESGRGRR
jgi:hypothetical protein